MEDDDEFLTVYSTHASETKAILKDLRSDNNWQFRIKAVNNVGAGESSDCTDFILIQDDRGMGFTLSTLSVTILTMIFFKYIFKAE